MGLAVEDNNLDSGAADASYRFRIENSGFPFAEILIQLGKRGRDHL
ncbi:MAG: hypothetical protein LBQ63_06870 [Deltaproteobacteria bacterium]|jgi:hypothetical protein|nr:hypothetical protein [Deltaproteobacteria bacterium]